MANKKHLAILGKGVAAWNEWREQHPDIITPDLSGANLFGADLSGADLSGAVLSRADLIGAKLIGANLSVADLADADLVDADLSGANLSPANLHEANLGGAKLSEAVLSEAVLSEAVLSEANLRGADLRGATLRWADLRNAGITGADLRRADLTGAHLRAANLDGALLSEAILFLTVLADVDLSTAKGLDTVGHEGPSTIGVDTIYRSQGKIPEVFLRGAGLPDEFIAYIGSLVGRPIQFYSCFISYAGEDQEFADRLYEGLQSKGVRCWFAPHDIQSGRKIHEQIDEAIRLHDKLLLILSEHSMNSEWVRRKFSTPENVRLRKRRGSCFPFGSCRSKLCMTGNASMPKQVRTWRGR